MAFVFSRAFAWRIRLSNKTNIVFAYNLDAVVDKEKFLKKYDALISSVRNEINSLNLGSCIRIIVARSDINFNAATAAEAMTVLGLTGSTILVWGHVNYHKRKEIFSTKFSYEFGHPKGVDPIEAKAIFGTSIQKVLDNGLISLSRMPFEVFREQITPTVLVLLGLTAVSLGLLEPAEKFLETFIIYFNSQDILRKRELGLAYLTCQRTLVNVYRERIRKSELWQREDFKQAERYAKKILAILPDDYEAHVCLAYIYEDDGDTPEALTHFRIASSNAPRNSHAHLFDSAYFALMDSNFQEAISIYDSIPLDTTVDTAIVANFLNKKYVATNHPRFLLGDGYVTWKWRDKLLARKTLEKFLLIADSTIDNAPIEKIKDLLYPKPL
jgi:tetratricopeptide (TPR) repeat protein